MRLPISTETFHVSDDVVRSTFARRPSPGDPKGTKGPTPSPKVHLLKCCFSVAGFVFQRTVEDFMGCVCSTESRHVVLFLE
eukprot:scaffold618_cov130-Cylindrotheca_fusiformis.AAC.4